MIATIITCYLLKSGRSPGTHRWGFFCKRPKVKTNAYDTAQVHRATACLFG